MISQFSYAGNATIPISGQSQCLISYKFAHVMSQRAIGKSALVINAVNEADQTLSKTLQLAIST